MATEIQQGHKVALERILRTLVASPKTDSALLLFCLLVVVVVVGGGGSHSVLPKD